MKGGILAEVFIDITLGVLLLFGGVALILFGVPIVAAVLGG